MTLEEKLPSLVAGGVVGCVRVYGAIQIQVVQFMSIVYTH